MFKFTSTSSKYIKLLIVLSKIDENRCKQTLARGVRVVSVYSYIEPTTDYCI